MKLLIALLICFNVQKTFAWSDSIVAAFDRWKHEFNIPNVTCRADKNIEIFNFIQNKIRIDEHNKLYKNCSSSYALGLWEKSDKTTADINRLLNGLRPSVAPKTIYITGIPIETAPEESFDWSREGYVTPVRNQGNCACCYAFAATGALEAQVYKKYQKLVKLSDQQLIDCSKGSKYGNGGCSMGNTENAYKYIKENGIAAGINYPFKAREDVNCKYEPEMKAATVRDYRRVPIHSNDFLRDLLYAIGPLAVGVDASLFSFQNYKTGIYDDRACTGAINHAMLLVGYGSDPKFGDYWILKNSYGRSFGENGFMKITREIPNFCRIWDYVIFPIVD